MLLDYYGINGFLFYDTVNVDDYVARIKGIEESNQNVPSGKISSLVYRLCTDFFEMQSKLPTGLDNVVNYIETEFNRKLTLTQLAEIGDMSVSKLSHDFKERFGVPVYKYILGLRLCYARNLIVTDRHLGTKQIAKLSGFDDVCRFCRAYKEKFGKSITEEKKEIAE